MFIRDHEYEPTLLNRLRFFSYIYFFKEGCMTFFDIMDIRGVCMWTIFLLAIVTINQSDGTCKLFKLDLKRG